MGERPTLELELKAIADADRILNDLIWLSKIKAQKIEMLIEEQLSIDKLERVRQQLGIRRVFINQIIDSVYYM